MTPDTRRDAENMPLPYVAQVTLLSFDGITWQVTDLTSYADGVKKFRLNIKTREDIPEESKIQLGDKLVKQ